MDNLTCRGRAKEQSRKAKQAWNRTFHCSRNMTFVEFREKQPMASHQSSDIRLQTSLLWNFCFRVSKCLPKGEKVKGYNRQYECSSLQEPNPTVPGHDFDYHRNPQHMRLLYYAYIMPNSRTSVTDSHPLIIITAKKLSLTKCVLLWSTRNILRVMILHTLFDTGQVKAKAAQEEIEVEVESTLS